MQLKKHVMVTRMVLLMMPAVTAIVACTDARPASGDSTTVASTRAAVESTTAAFHQALRTNDSTKLYSYVADDVLMIPPGESEVRGKDAMRSWYGGFLKQYQTSRLTLAEREVFVGDGWATELGSYEWGLKPTTGGPEVVDRGHYMQVWKLTPEGKWQFAREIWNSAIPAGT